MEKKKVALNTVFELNEFKSGPILQKVFLNWIVLFEIIESICCFSEAQISLSDYRVQTINNYEPSAASLPRQERCPFFEGLFAHILRCSSVEQEAIYRKCW